MTIRQPDWLRGRTAVIAIAVVLALTAAFSAGAMARGALQPPREVEPVVPSPTASPSAPFIGFVPADKRPPMLVREPIRVVGPTYGATERTVVRDDQGIPFAFRLPPGWTCTRYSAKQANGVRRTCIDKDITEFTAQVRIVISECPHGCQSATRSALTARGWPATWMPPAGLGWAQSDPSTRYAERTDANARYHLWMNHFMLSNGGYARVRVGVYADVPSGQREVVQKIVNDIRTQT